MIIRTDKLEFEFGIPQLYNTLGCSPNLTISLCNWLQSNKKNIEYIKIALYLFNNKYLFNTLKDLAESDISIDVFSIPLEGYDKDYPKYLDEYNGRRKFGPYTKLDCASPIYHELKKNSNSNFRLHIVPHMYLRSNRVKSFSRGNMPYSLHCKSIFVKFKNNKYYAGITSSNLAVRDAQKLEVAYIMSLENKAEITSARDFYRGLQENSIPIESFNPNNDYSHFPIITRNTPDKSVLMFTAPFYKDSAAIFESNIIKIIQKAKHRIIICAQHISSYNYYINGQYLTPSHSGTIRKDGFLKTVLDKAKSGVQTTFLSQTYVDENGSHGCRAPENKKSFIEFITAAKKIPNCNYYVNPSLHAKFIIVDNIVLITTCNFTPTQFIYLPNVEITNFINIPNVSYSGIFCEIGSYIARIDANLTQQMLNNIQAIINLDSTRKMFHQ